jgi:hypothetical protein
MLTIAATLRQQGRNVVDYVTDACVAALRDLPPPSCHNPDGHSLLDPPQSEKPERLRIRHTSTTARQCGQRLGT